MRSLPLTLLVLLAACADAPEPAGPTGAAADTTLVPTPSGPDRALARIAEVDGSGAQGAVEFVDLGDAVEVRYNLTGLSSGRHGFHVHQTGDCGPDSTGTPAGAAGGHFNPLASDHGAPGAAPSQRHAGDLGNIEVGADGRAIGVRVDSVLSFRGPTSILGKAMLVHAGEDDLTSQPSGDAGARVGCGVIEEAAAGGSLPDSVVVPTSVEP
jgi:Cu-Zn family superoxide dismutase